MGSVIQASSSSGAHMSQVDSNETQKDYQYQQPPQVPEGKVMMLSEMNPADILKQKYMN